MHLAERLGLVGGGAGGERVGVEEDEVGRVADRDGAEPVGARGQRLAGGQ